MLFSSKTKERIVLLLYQDPHKTYHMRLIQRLVGGRINAVRGALIGLVKDDVCTQERIGKKIVFQANHQGLYYDDLLRIATKQSGICARIIEDRLRLGKIRLAFVTADFYKQLPREEDQIDLFIIGAVSLVEVAKLAKEEGERRGIEVNYSVMTPEEFSFRKKNKDPFLVSILQRGRLILFGKEEQLTTS